MENQQKNPEIAPSHIPEINPSQPEKNVPQPHPEIIPEKDPQPPKLPPEKPLKNKNSSGTIR